MTRFVHPQIVTANDLVTGEVIYLTGHENWSGHMADAAVAHNSQMAEALLAKAQYQQDKIVGAYLADICLSRKGEPEPVHFRELFRSRGPSNYHHGKQAEG